MVYNRYRLLFTVDRLDVEMNKRMNRLIQGALILTIAGIISKILSAFYRIPIQNLTGDLGFYLYQQIYPFIAIVMILTLYSFPAAISQMGAAMGHKKHDYRFFLFPNLLLLYIINGVIGISIFIIAPYLARLTGDANIITAYRLIAISFLFVPVISLLRGIFQAEDGMQYTAISQIIEQIMRVFIIIIGALFIYKQYVPLYHIATYGVIATIVGLSVASVYLILVYRNYRNKHIFDALPKLEKIPYRYYLHTLLIFAFAVAMNHMIFIIIQLADVLSIVPFLEKANITRLEAMDAKGIFDRAVPLIQLGMVIGSSFALAFIPFLATTKNEEEKAIPIIQDALAITVYLAVGATVGLFILFPEANKLLFNDTAGVSSMRIFILSIGLLAIIMTVQAILQSYGERIRTACYIGSVFFVKLILNYVFVPTFELHGAAMATLISLVFLCVLSIRLLKRKFHHLQLFSRVRWLALSGASIVMAFLLFFIKYIVMMPNSRSGLFVYVIGLIVLGAAGYMMTLIRYHALTERQLGTLPFSSKWIACHRFISKRQRKEEIE